LRLKAVVHGGAGGAILITGEPGAGKTWLVGRLASDLPPTWQVVTTEANGALDAIEFLRLVGDALGLTMPERLGAARLVVRAALRDAYADGRRWLLVVDHAQRISAVVWEEIQVCLAHIGQPDGFAGLIVLGRTELARHLSARRMDWLAACLSLHIHLMPLDLDEALELLSCRGGTAPLEVAGFERLHRDALGNPARLLRLAASRSSDVGSPAKGAAVAADACRCTSSTPRRSGLGELTGPAVACDSIAPAGPEGPPEEHEREGSPPLVPARPPIRLEEGLVEVGWEGDLDEDLTHAEAASRASEGSVPVESRAGLESVDDRYAALQAWTEWARNRERSAAETGAADLPPEPGRQTQAPAGSDAAPMGDESTDPLPRAAATAGLRGENPHEFAPYSQLFSRLRQSRQS
jgi:general secretion pathway protein A